MWPAAHSWSPAAQNCIWGECVYVTSWCFASVIIYTFFLCLAIQLTDKRDTVLFTVWVCMCVCFLCSVTVNEPWNMTIGEGFSQSSLQRCCTLTPSTQFNCSQFFEALWRKTFFYLKYMAYCNAFSIMFTPPKTSIIILMKMNWWMCFDFIWEKTFASIYDRMYKGFH